MRRHRMRNAFKALVAVLSLIYLILFVSLPAILEGGDVAKFLLEFLPKSCYGVVSQTQALAFRENLSDASRNKRILLWTYMWHSRSWVQPLGQETFLQCPEQRCELTTDRCLQPISDAVLFYWPSLYGLPDHHPPWQTWVLGVYESEVTYESPGHGSTEDLDGKINWIFSSRFDADIYMPYYYFFKILENPKKLLPIVPHNTSGLSLSKTAQQLVEHYEVTANSNIFTLPAKSNINYAQNKTKFALWYVSNCYTKGTNKRMELFKELRKYIDIDVFGKAGHCGELGVVDDPCNRDPKCSSQLMSSYKFYLSFENSQCNYYITEKFFNPLRVGTLPVAFGAPLNHYQIIAPENSFLHISNFSSIEDLANYMKYLDHNDKEYNKYFKWKESHVEPKHYNIETDFYCKLCSDLWDATKKPKIYENFSEWWNKDKNCILPDENYKF